MQSEKNCAHCLRPTFTAKLAKLLEQGRSINLIGESGQGRGRLLEDLQGMAGQDVLWLMVNMKTCRSSFAGFLTQLWEQTGMDGLRPADFGRLTRRFEKAERRVVFLFHQFDAILDNPDGDPRFDVKFLDGLNALHNRGMALVCVTARPYTDYLLVSGNQVHKGSTLDLAKEPVPALSSHEVDVELERLQLSLNAQELVQLASSLLQHARPMALLEQVRRRVDNGEDKDLPFFQRLERWRQELDSSSKGGLNPGGVVELRNRAVIWYRASGLDRILPGRRLFQHFSGLLSRLGGKGSGK
jgi:hypothetical protein